MIIHVVKEGETVHSIAESYGVSVDRLALENGISSSANLAVGETLVILFPEILYLVQEGDSLSSIAKAHDISIMELLRNNPYLADREYIYPGELMVIKYQDSKVGRITTNGYAYPFIGRNLLKKTLPYLTYISIYSHYYTKDGEVLNLNDAEIIRTARAYGVAPVMILTGLAASPDEEIEVIHNLLTNEEIQDRFLENLMNILRDKDYYGVNITTPYILPQDRSLYKEFIERFATRLREEGYRPFITLTLNTFELLTNITYGDLQYDVLGELVDYIIIITYEWGFAYELPPTVVSFVSFINIAEYIVGLVDPNKLAFGFSTIGYIWRLPYINGVTQGQSISYNGAIDIAREFEAVIHFDDITKASYFQYYSDFEHILRFRDARAIEAIAALAKENNVNGLGIWNIMYFFNQMWLVLNSQFEIEKVLPLNLLEGDNITDG